MLSSKEEIGKMDRKILFQKKILGTDASNQQKVTGWENIDSSPRAWAKVDENSGTEVNQADQLVGVKSTTFTIRYRDDVTIENRIVYNGGNYDIHTLLQLSRKRFLKIIATGGGQYT